MNTLALGGYIKGLREEQGKSPAEVVVGLKPLLGRNIDPTTIWRIESAKMMPGSDLLLALLQVLKGSAADAWAIMSRDDLSAADGEERGRAAVKGLTLTDADVAVLSNLEGEQRQRLRALLEERRRELEP